MITASAMKELKACPKNVRKIKWAAPAILVKIELSCEPLQLFPCESYSLPPLPLIDVFTLSFCRIPPKDFF